MSYTLVLEWMPGDLYMSAVTARCTAPTSSYSVVWLPPNKVYQITLYCGSTSLVSFLVGAFRGKAWSYMKDSYEQRIQNQFGAFCVRVLKNEARHIQRDYASLMRQRNRGLAKRQKTLADAEKRIAELDTIFKRLYEDTISGKLSDERFQKLSTDYEKEQHQLQDVAAALRDEIEAEEQKSANVERFLSVVERYTEIPELTPCILHEFVEKIVVHAASDPKGKNRTQEIDIYYKGIGALEVSKVTSSRQE